MTRLSTSLSRVAADAVDARHFEAIVIGASAGGIEVLSLLLPALPARLRSIVLVVVHLPPQRASLLADIFAPRCALPVKEAEDKEVLMPGTVYFAPPDYHLLIERGGVVALSYDEPDHFSRPSIDALFESATDVFGQRLLGIVLTGASEDGAAGLAAVRFGGGTAIAQNPASAQMPLMPEAARKRSGTDKIFTPTEIAAYLASLD